MDTPPPGLAAHPEASRPYSADARASKAKPGGFKGRNVLETWQLEGWSSMVIMHL